MKPVSAKKIIETIENLGLKLTEQTGGSFDPAFHNIKRGQRFLSFYNLSSLNEDHISILDPGLFLKSVHETEKSLEMKLFS